MLPAAVYFGGAFFFVRVATAKRWSEVALVVAAGLFALPDGVAARWPWALTPLTARTLAAVYALGLANVLVAADGRASRVRLQLEVQTVMLALIAIAVVLRRADFAGGPAAAYGFAAVVAVELAVVAGGLVAISGRGRAPARWPNAGGHRA